jgi:glycine cleavage system H lipoate-binding protein
VIAVNNEIKKDYSILVLDPYNKGWLLLLEPMQLEEELKNLKDVHSDFDPKYHLP